ncbi:MAG: translation initiation factor IF-2 N-terminal domain-containing protein, partial [Lachnospiraceae bacterium]|nr:translation initiation factor IF-2 N-terminal domain-containing protein [Lachnospiraceae bacterium]
MAKYKVHELSKEIDVPSKDIVSFLQEQGSSVKAPMSTVEDKEAEMVKKHFASKAKSQPSENKGEVKSDAKQPVKTVTNVQPAGGIRRPDANSRPMQSTGRSPLQSSRVDSGSRPGQQFKRFDTGNGPVHVMRADGSKSSGTAQRPIDSAIKKTPAFVSRQNGAAPVGVVYKADQIKAEKEEAEKKAELEKKASENTKPINEVKSEETVADKKVEVKEKVNVMQEQPSLKKEEAPAVKEKQEAAKEDTASYNNREKSSEGFRRDNNSGNKSSFANGERKPFNNGDRPQYQDRQQRNYNGERKQFNQNGERKPFNNGDRPQRQFGDRPSFGNGERKPFNNGDRPQRQFGDRPSYGNGERKPFNNGDRPQRQFGDKPSFGDRNSGSNKSFGNNRNGAGFGGGFDKDSDKGDNQRRFVRKDSRPQSKDSGISSEIGNDLNKKRRATEISNRGKDKEREKKKDFDGEFDKLRNKKDPNRKGAFIKPVVVKEEQKEDEIKTITIPEVLTLKELSEKMKQPVAAMVKKLFLEGKMFTPNQDLSFEEAEEIALEYNCIAEKEVKVNIVEELLKDIEDPEEACKKRPPV